MSDQMYHNLAKVLDTLPNGFPATESGVEIKLLKRIFKPEEADLFCDLRLSFETAEQIAERTGRPLEGLEGLFDSTKSSNDRVYVLLNVMNRLVKTELKLSDLALP